ncbi:MAG: hypothetical protein LH606_22625 [Cytophagaceae bacterium]|nr:hypothetical protein [Cytophagaceae bacterium]
MYSFFSFGKIPLHESDFEAIIGLTRQDKKNRAGQVRFALLDGLGACRFDVPVTPRDMRAALGYYAG